MMRPAQRHRVLVTDLLAKTMRLGKAHMVRIAGLAPADEARLLGDKAQVLPIALPPQLWQGRAPVPGVRRRVLRRGPRARLGAVLRLFTSSKPSRKRLPHPRPIGARQRIDLAPGAHG